MKKVNNIIIDGYELEEFDGEYINSGWTSSMKYRAYRKDNMFGVIYADNIPDLVDLIEKLHINKLF